MGSENEVRAAKLTMDIKLERRRTELIQTKAENKRLEAQMQGEAAGLELGKSASSFIKNLNETVPDLDNRIELYKLHTDLKSRNIDTKNLASGNAKLYLTPADLKLKLMMGGENDRRLSKE